MSERDPIVTLLRKLDGPVDPRPEFADALLARLLKELAETDRAPERHGTRRPRSALPARLRRPLLAGAAALAGAAIVIAAVVVSRPAPASALDVIRQAQAAFAHMPPFQATYKVALNPDGTNPNPAVKKGATAIVALSYGGPHRLRTQILAEHGFTSGLAPGSYRIYTGRSPLEFLSWHGAYPDWERVCRGMYSRVFADARIAGRDARHIRCGNNRGYVWELWIDRQTGLLLKIVGQLDSDDSFLGGGISTSAKGGLEVEQLRYNPAFGRGTFSAPRRPFDAAAAARQATLAKLPPFHAVIASYGSGGTPGSISYLGDGWWLDEHTWRSEALLDHQRGGNFTGAGSFSVKAHGTLDSYNAHDNTYGGVDGGPTVGLVAEDPAQELIGDYSPARCPIVGHARVAEREADHRRCARDVVEANPHHKTWATAEYWIDAATGLTLRSQVNGHDLLVVRNIRYHPHFPPGIFRFVPPPGSHDVDKLENNPYYKTKLAPGKPAPNWHATTLAGKRFQLTDLRGNPALLLLLPDWCPCNEFIPLSQLPPLEQAYRHSHGATTVIWVDAEGNTKAAKTIARLNNLTFPVIVDKGAVEKAWAPQSFPKWVLLDSHGHVIEARLGPQTVAQLEQLLARR
jgi:hypothetical protein